MYIKNIILFKPNLTFSKFFQEYYQSVKHFESSFVGPDLCPNCIIKQATKLVSEHFAYWVIVNAFIVVVCFVFFCLFLPPRFEPKFYVNFRQSEVFLNCNIHHTS